jgi:hypothetical protein
MSMMWDLDTSVYRFNKSGDVWTIRDLCTGVLVLGSPGSGKSSCVMALLRHVILARYFGAMVLCAKPGEARVWIEDAIRHKRGDDIVHVTKHGKHVFDPLMYESRRSKHGADMNNVAAMLMALTRVGKPHVQAGDQTSEFFTASAENAVRYGGYILVASGENFSLMNLKDVIDSTPHEVVPDDESEQSPEAKAWTRESYLGRLLLRIVERHEAGQVPPDQWRGAEQGADYFLKKWPSLAPATRTSIEQTLNTLIAKLIAPPYDRLAADGRCTWLPEQAYTDGKLIILDIPTLEHGTSAELLQVAYKLAYQGAICRRDLARYPRPCALFADEFQTFSVPQDSAFQELVREAGGIVCYATQSLQGVARRLHEHKPGSGVFSLVGNIQNRVVLQSSDEETVRWMADAFGKEYQNVPEMHGQHVSIRNDYRYKVEPATLTSLPTPTRDRPYAVGCVYRGGQLWQENGEPYLFHAFPRI